jgi:hypothetical protein
MIFVPARTAPRGLPRADCPARTAARPGVAATTRPDAQAKGLGEYLRSHTVSVPAGLAAEFM